MSSEQSSYGEKILPPTPEPVRMRLRLMGELQASLLGSRTALLALDLSGIEQGTREQIELSRKLARNIGCGSTCSRGMKPLAERHRSSGLRIRSLALDPQLEKDLRQSELSVLQSLRLQSALLARARTKLRMLSNILAGPTVNYGPPLNRTVTCTPAYDFEVCGEL